MKKTFVVVIFLSVAFFFEPAHAMDLVPSVPGDRIMLRKILFLPNDAVISEADAMAAIDLLGEFVTIARSFYYALLETDTFAISSGKEEIYRSDHPASFYTQRNDSQDSAHLITGELLSWLGENRLNSRHIFLVIFVRPESSQTGFFGGGRTFNGPPNTGGGYVEMEYRSLIMDDPYPFLSTLIHELGHAFGLAHVNCFSRDMNRNDSIMSYNQKHKSVRMELGRQPGTLNPEEFFVLSLNKRVFPDFVFIPEAHNPENIALNPASISGCFLAPMDESIGIFSQPADIGYELYFDGSRVNGAEAMFWSFPQALANAEWNANNQKKINVECYYNGILFYSTATGFLNN